MEKVNSMPPPPALARGDEISKFVGVYVRALVERRQREAARGAAPVKTSLSA